MMRSVLLALLLSYVAIAALAFLFADRLIFLPPAASYRPDRSGVIHVPTRDGARIAVLHLPNPSASLTLLYSHGNAEDLGHIVDLLEAIRDSAGVSVMAYDYRGYGHSTGGRPTTAAATRDLEAVFDYATRESGIPSRRLILHGRSVGVGPTLELASRDRVAGIIVESGFVSAFRVMTHVALFPFDRFPNLRHIAEVDAPVLVIHGTEDEVIPFSHGRRLFRAAPGPKWRLWVQGAGHNDLVDEAGGAYWSALREFVRAVESDTATP